ncbi:hypothetical protein Hanom_Chr04g00322181 [Helianthus anomalus]
MTMSRISLASFEEMATTSTSRCRRTPGNMSILLKDVAVGLPTTVLRNVVCLLIFNPDRIRATERKEGTCNSFT